MNIRKLLANPRFRLERGDPPDEATLATFLRAVPENLPVKYLRFMRLCDGARGDSPYDSGHLEIWSLDRAQRAQAEHRLPDALPGFFGFGSDGADRLFVFDLREEDGAPISSVRAEAPDADDLEPIASSFSEFLEHIVLMRGGG